MRSLLISVASAFGLLLLACAFSGTPAAAQSGCTTTYNCQGNSGCSSVMGGNITQRSITDYKDQASCDAAARQIMASEPVPTITCSCGGSGTTSSDLSGQMGQLIATMTPQQQLGLAAGAVGTVMIFKGLSELMQGKPAPAPDPAAQQRALAAQQLNNSGIYLMKQKNYSGAVNEFQQALAQAPNDKNIANNLAMAKQAQQNSALAQQRSGTLGQLLGTTPAAAGNPEIASNSSPLDLVNLNNPSSGAGDLHPPGEAPPVNQAALQNQIDGALGNQPPAPAPTQTQAQDIDQIFNSPQSAPAPPQTPQAQIDAEQKQVDNLFATPGGSTPAAAQLAQQASLGQAAANAPSPEAASAMAGQGFDTAAGGTVTPQASTPQAAAVPAASPPIDSSTVDLTQSTNQPLVVADLKTPPAPAAATPAAGVPTVPLMRTAGSDTFSAPGSPIFDCAGDRVLIQRLGSGLHAQDDAIQRTEAAMKSAREDSAKAQKEAMSAAVSTLISSASTATSWAQAGIAKAGALRSTGITAEDAEQFKRLTETNEMLERFERVNKAAEKLTELSNEDQEELNARPEEHAFSNASEVESATKILEDNLRIAEDAYKEGKFDEVLEEGAAKGATVLGGPVAGAAMHTLISGLELYVNAQQAWNSAGEAEEAEHNLEVMRDERAQVRSRMNDLQQEIATECSNTKTAGR